MKNSGLLFFLLAMLVISCSRDNTGKNPSGPGKEKVQAEGPGPGKDKVVAEEPEMKWAKEIADLFLTDLQNAKFDHAGRLVVMARQKPGPGSLVSSDLRDELEAHDYKFKDGDEVTSWTITSSLLSPAKDEAAFKGTMQRPKRTTTFSLRIVKEKSDGKWRVEAFSAKTSKKV